MKISKVRVRVGFAYNASPEVSEITAADLFPKLAAEHRARKRSGVKFT